MKVYSVWDFNGDHMYNAEQLGEEKFNYNDALILAGESNKEHVYIIVIDNKKHTYKILRLR